MGSLVTADLKSELLATDEALTRHLSFCSITRVKVMSENESLWLVSTPTFVTLRVKYSYYRELRNLVSCEKWS